MCTTICKPILPYSINFLLVASFVYCFKVIFICLFTIVTNPMKGDNAIHKLCLRCVLEFVSAKSNAVQSLCHLK